MPVLMFGWEFPPRVSGGLGVACEGLVRGLLELDTRVTLVLPFAASSAPREPSGLRVVSLPALASPPASRRVRLHIRRIRTLLAPYQTEALYLEEWRELEQTQPERAPLYGPDLSREVLRYSAEAAKIGRRETFDVIHAHDWLTYLAGME